MLNAIGIYQIDPYSKPFAFQKIMFAQADKSYFFQRNQLEKIEKQSFLKLAGSLATDRFYCSQVDNEYHYIKMSADNIAIAVSSRKELEKSEIAYLFANIRHIYMRNQNINQTLDNVIINPFGFTGKDLLISHTQQNLDELKLELFDVLGKVLDRGNALEELQPKVIKLNEASNKFRQAAERQRSCCRYW